MLQLTVTMVVLLTVWIVLVVVEYQLAKRRSRWAFLLPAIVAAVSVLLVGWVGIALAAALAGICAAVWLWQREEQGQQKELDKMDIQDL
ncbi:MAG: hypothetical protein ACOX7F_01450 [Eubacteriales bacterium]|jgi:predicted branched-subunit amino acid permease